MIPRNLLTIAVDFDGTIVDDKYPGIGSAKIFAFDTLLELHKKKGTVLYYGPTDMAKDLMKP